MSSILDALQRARREARAREQSVGEYAALDPSRMPRAGTKPTRMALWARILVATTSLLVLLAAGALGLVIVMLKEQRSAGNAQTSVAVLPVAAAKIPAPAPTETIASPRETISPTPTMNQAFVPIATPFPVSSPAVSMSAQAASPVATGTPPPTVDLPMPVPITELKLEPSSAALPPLPVAPAPDPTPSLPKIGTIMYDETMRVAVINGKTCHEGDMAGDYKVIRIEPTQVTIQRKGENAIILSSGR